MKHRMRFVLLIALVLVANGVAFPFGGENPLGPGENIGNTAERKNWHHQDIAYDALIANGFRPGPNQTFPGAAEAITWHADYIDSYLYNPLFWIPGGINRFKVALATEPELIKLHFDDNFSLPAVQAAYRKYVTGTMAGLMWARERGDVASAHNILGVSLHAMADFYAHSNWVDDPARRQKTWFDFNAAERSTMPIFTGAYEEPEQLAVKHHGKIMPMCTLIKGGLVEQVLNVGCMGISPFTKSNICDHHRECKRAVNINPPAEVASIKLPNGLLYLLPGMALDSSWVMDIGYKHRGLKDSSPREIFETAKTLAKRASTQWLAILEAQMARQGATDFWNRLKTETSWNQRHAPYENYSKFGYQFLSAGPYPQNPGRSTRSLETQKVQPFSLGQARGLETADRPIDGIRAIKLQNNEGAGGTEVSDQPLRPKPLPIKFPFRPGLMPVQNLDVVPVPIKPVVIPGGGTPGPITQIVKDDYYLRVKLRTATETYSGTDSDIILHAAGKQFLLDYMPRENPLIAYNDLENGDEQVYVVGPFDGIPTEITLENRSADAGEVLAAFGKAFVEAIKNIIEKIGDFLLTLIGGHPDYVGIGGIVWEPSQLAGIGSGWQNFSKYIDGGDEGKYTISGQIRKTGESSLGHSAQDWAEYQVKLDNLHCNKESTIDQPFTTWNDEPFVLAIVVPHPGSVRKKLLGPYGDVDTGDNNGLNYTFSSARIPKAFGRLSVQFQMWESDSESGNDRSKMLDGFASKAEGTTDPMERGLLDTIGAALAADWKLAHLEIYAFGRGNRVHAGTVYNAPVNKWIEGKKRMSFPLNTSACRDLGVTSDQLQTPPVTIQLQPGLSAPLILKDGLKPLPLKQKDMSSTGLIPAFGFAGLILGLASIGIGRRFR